MSEEMCVNLLVQLGSATKQVAQMYAEEYGVSIEEALLIILYTELERSAKVIMMYDLRRGRRK